MGDRIITPKICKSWEHPVPVKDYDVHETEFLPETTRVPAPTECAYCGASPLDDSQVSEFPEDYVTLYDCTCSARSYCGKFPSDIFQKRSAS